MAADTEEIALSVIVPTGDRAESLRACLESLNGQTEPTGDWEVVVVVDGSSDGTRGILSSLATRYRLRVCEQEHAGQSTAINRGVACASAPICLFLSDDVLADPGLVAAHLRAQREEAGRLCIGRVELRPRAEAGWYALESARWWNGHHAALSQGLEQPSWLDCSSSNLSVPRAALVEVGGFADDLPVSGDFELGYRLGCRGMGVRYIAQAVVEQDAGRSLGHLTAETEERGQAHVALCRRHPGMLPELLGGFPEATPRTILLCRLLLQGDIPPVLLQWTGALVDRPKWRADWFRFIHHYSYWRGIRHAMPDEETWQRLTHGTLILMYHAFGGPGEPPSRYVLPASRFARQMAWLKRMGYHVLSLEEYLGYRREHRLPPARSVVITIDDGYVDILTRAFPILRKYGFPATIFLVSEHVGGCNCWDTEGALAGRPLLSWTEIRELLRGGMQVGAHTRTHPVLTDLLPEQLVAEIAGSRADLEGALATPVRAFCYPHGKQNPLVQQMVEEAGFFGACSTQSGTNTGRTPLYMLCRGEVMGTDSLLAFAASIWSGFTWRARSRASARGQRPTIRRPVNGS